MIDVPILEMKAKIALALLQKADKIAGGTRMGCQEAIDVLETIPELIVQLREEG